MRHLQRGQAVAFGSAMLLCAGTGLLAPPAFGSAAGATTVSTAASSVAVVGTVSGRAATVLPAGSSAPVASEAPEESGLKTLDNDYHRLYPHLSSADIGERRQSLETGMRLTERFASYRGYAGAQLDMESGSYVVLATNKPTLDVMTAFAASIGLNPRPMLVKFTYQQLETGFKLAGSRVQGIKGADVTMDVIRNRFVVTFPSSAADHKSLVTSIPGGRIEFSDKAPVSLVPFDGGCTSRFSCGYPVRAGISIGPYSSSTGTSGTGCTLGFAAAATDGSRWIYTACHCTTASDLTNHTIEGHGQQPFGDVRQRCYWYNGSCSYSGVDVSRIRQSSSYWDTLWGGYLWAGPGSRVNVDYAIQSLSTISVGQSVCKSSLSDNPGVDNCGVVDAVSSTNGVHVSGIHVCPGDSGGPVYAITGGERWAYGLVSLGPAGGSCATNLTFSALPVINDYMDATTNATVRVVYQ